MNEKIIDEIEDDISDEALEAGGTRAEVLAGWTILCTSSIQCTYGPATAVRVLPRITAASDSLVISVSLRAAA